MVAVVFSLVDGFSSRPCVIHSMKLLWSNQNSVNLWQAKEGSRKKAAKLNPSDVVSIHPSWRFVSQQIWHGALTRRQTQEVGGQKTAYVSGCDTSLFAHYRRLPLDRKGIVVDLSNLSGNKITVGYFQLIFILLKIQPSPGTAIKAVPFLMDFLVRDAQNWHGLLCLV